MKVQVGSGRVRLPGFLNVDIRPLAETDVLGHAGDLGGLADGSADVLFSHALFEHVFLRHQAGVVREWARVLAAGGLAICLGVPDFAAIARLYLERAPGVVGERFDLLNVYRYTHGEPEHATPGPWSSWRPDRRPDEAPPGWLPQLHKGLFDAGYLASLFEAGGLAPVVFRYAFPGEDHALNLGAIATHPGGRPLPTGDGEIEACLGVVPEIGRFVAPGSVAVADDPRLAEGLLAYASRPDPPRSPSLVARVRRRLGRALRRGRATAPVATGEGVASW